MEPGAHERVTYYDFRIEGEPVGYVEVSEAPQEIASTAWLMRGGVVERNAYRVALPGGRPERCRVGDEPWRPVPRGVYPSSAYGLVVRRRLSAFRSLDEGTLTTTDVEMRYAGDTAVELVAGAERRRFVVAGDQVVRIWWGPRAVSELMASRAAAVAGTAFGTRP